jgi:hypothetical protein
VNFLAQLNRFVAALRLQVAGMHQMQYPERDYRACEVCEQL